jgi:hypothetical protein
MNDLAERIEDEVYEDEDVLSEGGDEAEELQLEADDEAEDEQAEPVEAEAEESETDDDGLVVSIDGESPAPEEAAPEWVRDLRKQHREQKRRNRELEQELEQMRSQGQRAQPLGPKPTLEVYDYDTDKYERALADWFDRKRRHDAEQEAVQRQQQAITHQWEQKQQEYFRRKEALKARDFDDAEDVVKDILNVTQQGIIVKGAENPEIVVYALGKNPKKAQELAQIDDPIDFAFAISKLEAKLKVATKKSAPPPEKTVKGQGRVSGSVDSTLERLRAEAEKTGDYSKVLRYKKQLKANK